MFWVPEETRRELGPGGMEEWHVQEGPETEPAGSGQWQERELGSRGSQTLS